MFFELLPFSIVILGILPGVRPEKDLVSLEEDEVAISMIAYYMLQLSSGPKYPCPLSNLTLKERPDVLFVLSVFGILMHTIQCSCSLKGFWLRISVNLLGLVYHVDFPIGSLLLYDVSALA